MLKAILIALLVFSFAQSAFGQDYKVSSVSEDLTRVTLKDTTTGKKATVAKGQEIDGWRVVEITPSEVTLGRFDQGGTVLLRHLTIAHRVKPRIQSR